MILPALSITVGALLAMLITVTLGVPVSRLSLIYSWGCVALTCGLLVYEIYRTRPRKD